MEPSLGQDLRRLREERSLTLEWVATTTRIPLETLERMEADRLDLLPGPVYLRGYVRSYARALGVDPEPLLAQHLTSCPRPRALTPAIAPLDRARSGGAARALALTALLALVLVAVALAATLHLGRL